MSAALGIASDLKERLWRTSYLTPATVLVFGQSTEQGPVLQTEKAAFPRAFYSQRNPGFRQKRLIPTAGRGGYWAKVYDEMYDWGYDLDIVNAAVGGLSMLSQTCNLLQARQNNAIYYRQRPSCGYPDLGDFGDILSIGTKIFLVVAGARRRQAFNDAPFPSDVGTSALQDFVAFEQITALSGATFPATDFTGSIAGSVLTVSAVAAGQKPLAVGDIVRIATNADTVLGTISSLGTGTGGTGTYNLTGAVVTSSTAMHTYPPIGGTVVDGAITLKRLDPGLYSYDADFFAGVDANVNGGQPNGNWAGTLGERSSGRGFDPLGVLATAQRMGQASAGNTALKIVYFSQGQSDLGISAAGYQRAVMLAMTYFLRRDWIVVIGNTVYSPGSASSATGYAAQVQGAIAAVDALKVPFAGKVYRGADLHATSVALPAMGGQRVTGSVSDNVLTVTATAVGQGNGVAVGQNVWNGTALVGIITALGTGTGGTGTYVLDRTATVASTTLLCMGQGIQNDGVHFNGSVVDPLGAAVANALKAVLPRRNGVA